ncbi:MAG: hypothetical protein ACYS8W_00135 [Planctomycetota bacterium]
MKLRIICIVLLIFAAGCASKIYIAPTMGRSGEQQLAISRAIDSTLDRFELERIKGKNVAITIRSLGQEEDESAAMTGYLGNALHEKIVRSGGRYLRGIGGAQIVLLLSIWAGVDTTERDFTFEGIPLYENFVVKGHVKGMMMGFDREKNEFFSLRPAEAVDERACTYLFHLFESDLKLEENPSDLETR